MTPRHGLELELCHVNLSKCWDCPLNNDSHHYTDYATRAVINLLFCLVCNFWISLSLIS